MDRLVLKRNNRYKVGRNDLKQVIIDTKDERRFRRCVDQPKKISLPFLKCFAEYWLAVLYRNTRIRWTTGIIPFPSISKIYSEVIFMCIPVPFNTTDCIVGGTPLSSP